MLKALASITALASCHLDKYSTATIMYWFPFSIISNDLTNLLPIGQKVLMVVSGVAH